MGVPLKCLLCNDVIVSHHRHDFKWCKCKSVAIDGGDEYTRVLGEPENWKLLIEEIKDER